MSEKHDVTKSSNPDVQVLLGLVETLARSVAGLTAEVAAIRGELASLPQQYVVPGPTGEIPNGTVIAGGTSLQDVGQNGAGYPGDVVSIKPAKVKKGKPVDFAGSDHHGGG